MPTARAAYLVANRLAAAQRRAQLYAYFEAPTPAVRACLAVFVRCGVAAALEPCPASPRPRVRALLRYARGIPVLQLQPARWTARESGRITHAQLWRRSRRGLGGHLLLLTSLGLLTDLECLRRRCGGAVVARLWA